MEREAASGKGETRLRAGSRIKRLWFWHTEDA